MEHRVVDLMADHAAVGRAPFLRSLDRVAVPGKLGHPPYSGAPETPRGRHAPFSVATTLGGLLAGGQLHRRRAC
jgi:hypothetical protein